FHPVGSDGGMVASQELRASAVGRQILRQGGNAVDAAVATAFALAVTLPQAGNRGGGGFLVLGLPGPSPARGRGCVRLPVAMQPAGAPERSLGGGCAGAVNFRERAPLTARADLLLGADGRRAPEIATRSLRSTAVPGSVAGLTLVQRCYGRLPLPVVMAPSIALAEHGVPVSRGLWQSLRQAAPLLGADPEARRLYLHRAGQPPLPGTLWRQPALAATLHRIAREGDRGFYRGPVADALVRLMEQRGGLIRQVDLDRYRAQLVPPLIGRFRGHTVLTMPPPSGGGVTLLQLLAILEPLPLERQGLNSAVGVHTLVEAMNLAYRDRNRHLGDPDQVAMPLAPLLSARYAAELRGLLDPQRHRPARELDGRPASVRGGSQTTHLSVVDGRGGLVALTTTLNLAYGNGIAIPGSGVLLNNEMDDFAAAAGAANSFGLVQGPANAIAPGKRPLSSMTPTLVLDSEDRPMLALGSPGGSRIITAVLQVLLNRLVHGLNLAGAVAAPRVHSQLWPDQITLEEGISPDTQRLLEGLGHQLVQGSAQGAIEAVEWRAPRPGQPAASFGVADPRRPEGAALGTGQP
ncbi:MAG: gamma-glutamyltransferase, partial [Cyanobacteriota bacterium]